MFSEAGEIPEYVNGSNQKIRREDEVEGLRSRYPGGISYSKVYILTNHIRAHILAIQHPFIFLLVNNLPLILVHEILVVFIPTLLFPWGACGLANLISAYIIALCRHGHLTKIRQGIHQ